MAKHKIHILPDDIQVAVEGGTTISKALQKAGIRLTYPCGGKGTCGRCIVFADGVPVKGCDTCIHQDMVIHVPDTVRLTGQQVLTDIRLYDPGKNILPLVERVTLKLDAPTLDDAANDAARLKKALAAKLGLAESMIWLEPSCLTALPYKLRENDFTISVTVVHENNGVTVLSLLNEPLYGIAVDIGTTTVATALCDLQTGVVLDTTGTPNPQAAFGSDVISRIVYTEENTLGTATLQRTIINALSESIKTLASRAGISTFSIPVAVVAANTTMSHFLLGLPTDFLRREPYIPATCEYPAMLPKELGLPILPYGRVLVLPSISSYVGGDITAGVIAANLPEKEGLNLLVDVGTNGEMVLAGDGFMMACSCSAGPAFEGSGISCGSRAVQGAIDNVYYRHGHMVYDIIGSHSVEPVSLCGSGLISFLSALLQAGVIDRSGRFTDPKKMFSLAPKVTITEADVQNLIRAKAAIFAGIRVLIRHMEMHVQDIDHIFIAGGFGRNLNVGTATNIGMLPPLKKETFSYVGNSSLAGALRVLNDRTINANEMAASITNMELSVGNEFMDEFTLACFLPHTDFSLFKDPQ